MQLAILRKPEAISVLRFANMQKHAFLSKAPVFSGKYSKNAEKKEKTGILSDTGSMAEKEGFEPSIPFWGIHDFQSCALGQLRDFSIRTAHAASPVIIQQVPGFVKNFLPNFKNIFPSVGFCRRREKVSMGELAHIQLGVESALLEQFLVLSLLHNVAVPHY